MAAFVDDPVGLLRLFHSSRELRGTFDVTAKILKSTEKRFLGAQKAH